ncbi:MAG: hypothetical protein GDA40_05485 [Rhodobacteraceae bacterium]|nr:hypothetical protein [Paracoccaceae bacterium]
MAELRTAMEWVRIGGNVLGAQRINRVIADVPSDRAEPNHALAILTEALSELPEHGATIYFWTTLGQTLSPLPRSAILRPLPHWPEPWKKPQSASAAPLPFSAPKTRSAQGFSRPCRDRQSI